MTHSPKFIDLTGKTFGYLTVTRFDSIQGRTSMWECRCSCGTVKLVRSSSLRSGVTTSCGCHSKDFMKTKKIATTHGLRNKDPRLYRIWQNMKNRCRNPKVDRYKNYGGRGISVCEEWQEYPLFYKWAMENGYNDQMTIDRIDVNGNYEPTNCQWLTRSENSRKSILDRRKNAVHINCK